MGIARLLGFSNMTLILEIFLEKMLQVLVYADGSQDEGQYLISLVLQIFGEFMGNSSMLRILCKT